MNLTAIGAALASGAAIGAVLGLMGIHEVEFIYAEGLDNRPHGRDAGIASARAQIADLAVLA